MTTLTDTQVITASGGLVELGRVINANSVTITSTTGQTACGPLTVVCDGSPILVEYFCSEVSTQATAGNYAAFELHEDGAQRVGFWGVVKTPASASMSVPVHLQRVLTPSAGSHTYEVQAFVNAGTASAFSGTDASTTSAAPATLRVSKIVQATQWPAVTTGTIICTSSTRPASPFEGQKIYETDTDRELTYDSSAWVQTTSLGGWSTWTPQLYQNGNLTSTINHARYTRIGDTAIVQAKVSATQAGTAGQEINILNLPYSAEAAADYTTIGNAYYWDGTYRWLLEAETLPTATSIAFGYDSAPFSAYGGGRFGASPSKAVASGHFVSFALTYEIA